MPTFEFQCPKCSSKFELPDPQPVHCTFCDTLIQRIYSAPAVIYKGDGFYSTDNRKTADSGHSKGGT